MTSGSSVSTTARASRPIRSLLIAVLLPAAGLTWLGMGAYDAQESRATLQVRAALTSIERELAVRATAALSEADRLADAYGPGGGEPPGIAAVFVADGAGRIRVPSLKSLPAVTPPDAVSTESALRFLREADRALEETGDPFSAIPFVEASLGDFVHPDLVGVLLYRAARLYLDGGLIDRGVFLLEQLVNDLPAARDLEGNPLAPDAYLDLIQNIEDPSRRTEYVRELGSRLADHAWDLPPYKRDLLLGRLTELADLPDDLRDRAAFLDALRSRLLPEACALLSRARPGEWTHVIRKEQDGLEILGWRALPLDTGPHVYGYRLDRQRFIEELEEDAKELAALHDGAVDIGTTPAILAGSEPEGDTVEITTDLGGALAGIPVRIQLPAPGGFALLRVLHLSMTGLLAAALVVGAILSVRAVRRELATARLKQDFVDGVSHELRTPLTTIRMYAEMLAEDRLDDEERIRYRAFVLSESERLSRLIEDVLDFSRLSRGEAGLSAGAVAPVELIEAATALVMPPATEKGYTIRSEIPEGLPLVRADRDAAVRAIVNLLTNAVRYSGDAREIGVEVRREEDRVLATVWDRGPGIPPADRPHLFDRFYRSPRDARKVKGVGLGLVIARELARSMGGDLFLEESSEDGTRFTIAFEAVREDG